MITITSVKFKVSVANVADRFVSLGSLCYTMKSNNYAAVIELSVQSRPRPIGCLPRALGYIPLNDALQSGKSTILNPIVIKNKLRNHCHTI